MAKRVETDAGAFDADILVVALGADLDPDATPGLLEGGHEFYTVAGAFALRDVLADFDGGRVVVGVTSTPFKCPPAPSETALLMHDLPHRSGAARPLGDRRSSCPRPVPIPPSPDGSKALLAAFAERGITWHPERLVTGSTPSARWRCSSDGDEMPYDLFLGVPVHRAPAVVAGSGLPVDGWIPVNPLRSRRRSPACTPSATSPASARRRRACSPRARPPSSPTHRRPIRGRRPAAEYDGQGICYLEFGHDQVARVNVQFTPGAAQPLVGIFDEPTMQLAADKTEFGRSRARRWFGKDWAT